MKLFADDSSLFIRVNGVNYAQYVLETDLETIPELGHQWKMVFNPDITKQAEEVIFSVKKNKLDHPLLFFINIPVARVTYTKHLGLFLKEKLSFSKHIKEKIAKAMKGVALLKFYSNSFLRIFLTCHINFMCALTCTMKVSFIIIREWI